MVHPDLFDRPFPMNLVDKNRHLFTDAFCEWIGDNLHVFAAFSREAIKVKGIGFDHYAARTICEWIRHNTAVRSRKDDFKINNNHIPYLARLFDLAYPKYAGLFEYRVIKG